jgi:NAD(P)-dependent dehydrogenase (short-subunit alcohol dehydrogenase family)
MDLQLKGKVALVTGGSVGIGLAVAEELAREGVNLVLCARNGERLATECTRIARTAGVNVIGVPADVGKAADVSNVASRAEKEFGGLDILVNNAGTGSAETIVEAPDEKWQAFWDLHVMAAVRLARFAVPMMKRRGGGVIIHNASICARQPLWYEPIYNTTKAALVMFSKCLANEAIKDNIRVNTISPGLVMTPDWRKSAGILSKDKGISPDEYLDGIAKENAPIARFASPEELARFFVFLCSPCASYCVGSNYYVDGGWLRVTE